MRALRTTSASLLLLTVASVAVADPPKSLRLQMEPSRANEEGVAANEPEGTQDFGCEHAVYQHDRLIASLFKDAQGQCVGTMLILCGDSLYFRDLKYVTTLEIAGANCDVYQIRGADMDCAAGPNPKRFVAFERDTTQDDYHIYLSRWTVLWWTFCDDASKYPFQ